MLHWFARRMKEASEDEKGFTLIELLVVVIIIGILAAIAIPIFLNQRTQAQNSAVESDLRNIASAANACSADNNGSFANCGVVTDNVANNDSLDEFGYRGSNGVTMGTPTVSGTRFAVNASHTANPGATANHFDTNTGRVAPGSFTP